MAGPSDQKAGLSRDKDEVSSDRLMGIADLGAHWRQPSRYFPLLCSTNTHLHHSQVKAIIYEASKGSKYFLAQQQKDAELTVRVDRLVAHFDSLLKKQGGVVTNEERLVDEMLAEMEKSRVLSETIVVVDADVSRLQRRSR